MAAFFAGAMNSIAGGGSFLSFPALILAGVPSIPANATNSAAMWVGTWGGARAYWADVLPHKRMLNVMLAISIVGAILGATLLLLTPPAAFNRLIPWLLLFATLMFAVSPWLTKVHDGDPAHQWWQYGAQFVVAVYGGYFTAGIGILMLALLAFSGLPSFNATNGMKNVLAVAINGFSLVPFLIARIIDWRYAIPMAIVALVGGYIGAHLFRRVPEAYGRWFVIAIGAIMTIVFFVR
ncbi:MAG TPA: sulfite exporter TauE/SafE family protein [Verrucomicrobiae bacterium]|nr:sulfite exporter TauE/SafE family protein [Verrucomicrobiae bacterium]HTZ54209.1 sulfite exporter TauE/SafE family protein [Candidatus Acidoferrum sp.]